MLMPLLALTAASVLYPHFQDAKLTLVFTLTALAWGTAGDVLLLLPGEKPFIAGALCFLAGHLFWIGQFCSAYASLSAPAAAAGIVCIAGLLTAAYVMLGKPKGVMGAGVIVYGAILCTLVFTGIVSVYAAHSRSAVLFLSGAVLFLVSDSMLGYTVMKKTFPLSHVLIMFTYIAAQTLLTAAAVLPHMQSAAGL
jgi:Predicted membrane protein